jgi:hypothetical protein
MRREKSAAPSAARARASLKEAEPAVLVANVEVGRVSETAGGHEEEQGAAGEEEGDRRSSAEGRRSGDAEGQRERAPGDGDGGHHRREHPAGDRSGLSQPHRPERERERERTFASRQVRPIVPWPGVTAAGTLRGAPRGDLSKSYLPPRPRGERRHVRPRRERRERGMRRGPQALRSGQRLTGGSSVLLELSLAGRSPLHADVQDLDRRRRPPYPVSAHS